MTQLYASLADASNEIQVLIENAHKELADKRFPEHTAFWQGTISGLFRAKEIISRLESEKWKNIWMEAIDK